MAPAVDELPNGCTIRRATRDDNAAILDFYSRHAMQAEVGLRFDRAPDFFGLLDAHSPTHETLIVEYEGAIRAAGTVVLRPAYVGRRVVKAAYLGDLYIPPHRAVSAVWPGAFQRFLQTLRSEAGVEFIYSCVIRDNRLAHASLVKPRRPDRAAFTHWRGYSNVSILARKPWARRRTLVKVRRAAESDAEQLRNFLNEQSQQTAGGVVFDAPTWQHRLTSWPGFGLESFHVAENDHGRILGCLAPYDFSEMKRIVLLNSTLSLQAVKWIYNLFCRPRIESVLPNVYLTHVAIRDRNADVFAALLDAAYQDLARTQKYATVSMCLYDRDSLWNALGPYWHVAVPMDLYTLSGLQPEADVYPGFEIYLV